MCLKVIKIQLFLGLYCFLGLLSCSPLQHNITDYHKNIDTTNWNLVHQSIHQDSSVTKKVYLPSNPTPENPEACDSLVHYIVNGKLIREKWYAGNRLGATLYFPNGRKKSMKVYFNSNLELLATYHNTSANGMKTETRYFDGVKHGRAVAYYPQKKGEKRIKSIAPYIDGVLEGEVKFYRKSGSLMQVQHYENGQETKTIFYNRKGEYKACLGCKP